MKDKKCEEIKKSNMIVFKVRASKIFKHVFSFLNEKRKLSLILFNKEIKKKLGIDIKSYQKFYGSEIIGERNGIGVEYDLSTFLIKYEGEYLNWRKNGKGKEYHENGILKYDGEYINGKKNGKGKEYYENSILKYEGEYSMGERNGIGKAYYKNGNLKYEGEYSKGVLNGIGKE